MSLSGGLSGGLVNPLTVALGGGSQLAWTPARLPGTPREWLAGPTWCFTDGSAEFTAASNQFLSVASNSTLQTGDVDFWWAGWVKRADNLASYVFAAQDDATLGRSWTVDVSSSTYRFYTAGGGGGSVVATTQPSAGTFHFVLAWRDTATGTINIRINNGTTASLSTAVYAPVATGAFTLGARTYAGAQSYLNGNLASVAFGKSPPGGIASVISTISSRLYASAAGIVYADLTAQEKTAWGLVSWWDLVRSGVVTDSHGSNHLTNNNGVTFGAGLPRAACGDTDPVSVWVDHYQGTLATQTDPLKRPSYRTNSGRPFVLFDGVNDSLDFTPVALTTLHAWAAYRAASLSSTIYYMLGGSVQGVTAGGTFYGGVGGYDGTNARIGDFMPVNTDAAIQVANAKVWQGAVADETAYRNTGTLTGLTLSRIGQRADGVWPFDGRIYSTGFTTVAPSASERAALGAYLTGRF